MLIEYVGEVVRRSIVDLRERREYDARVGAGTYVFDLSPASGLSVDATRVRRRHWHQANQPCLAILLLSVRVAIASVIADALFSHVPAACILPEYVGRKCFLPAMGRLHIGHA